MAFEAPGREALGGDGIELALGEDGRCLGERADEQHAQDALGLEGVHERDSGRGTGERRIQDEGPARAYPPSPESAAPPACQGTTPTSTRELFSPSRQTRCVALTQSDSFAAYMFGR